MLATVAELERRLGVPEGSLSGEELARAEAALEDASALVRTAGRQSWTDATGENPAPEIVVIVTLRLAKRIYQNPEELRSAQLGDYSYQRANADGLLTAAELALVREAAGIVDSAFSVRTPGYWSGCNGAVSE